MPRILKASAIVALAAGAFLGAALAAPPARPSGHAARPGPAPARHVLRRHRSLTVRRLGGATPRVVVEHGGAVVRTLPTPVVVQSAGTLEKTPVPTVRTAQAGQTAGPGYKYKVVKVNDDATVVLEADGKQKTVRLIGVEPADVEAQQKIQKIEAKRFTENLLTGEFVCLEGDDNLADEDEDGHTVAYLYRAPDGLLLNLELVRQGYLLAADDYDYDQQKTMNFYENKAHADGKGMWSALPQERTRPPAKGRTGGPAAKERPDK